MASTNGTAYLASQQVPPVVRDLEAIFAALPDDELLTALTGSARRGPKGHPSTALWHAFVAKYRLGLASTDALIRQLHDNPYLADVCGFTIIPHKSTFSRFFAKLTEHLPLVQAIFERQVQQAKATLPGFGERVAVDSTVLKAWANGAKAKKVDPDAGWAVKQGTQGRTEAVFGFKLHLIADCEYELPIAGRVTAGNVSDMHTLANLVYQAKQRGLALRFVMADKGYDSALNRLHILGMGAVPIIEVNRRRRAQQPIGGQGAYFDRYSPITYGSAEFKALYSQRTAVERVFSRLKGQRALNKITVRRMAKVTVHCYLSLLVHTVGALL